jgi:ankyrin repeat protein
MELRCEQRAASVHGKAGRKHTARAARFVARLALAVGLLNVTSCAQTKPSGNRGGQASNAANTRGGEAQPSNRQRPLPDRPANTKEAPAGSALPTPTPMTPLVADADTPNISGPDHALFEAARRSDLNAVQTLLKLKGVNLNVRQNGMTPLLLAASSQASGAPEIFKLLLESGADVNVRNSRNETVLYLAAEHARLDAVRLLLAHKVDPKAPVHDPAKQETVLSLVKAKLREQPKNARFIELDKLLSEAMAGRVK